MTPARQLALALLALVLVACAVQSQPTPSPTVAPTQSALTPDGQAGSASPEATAETPATVESPTAVVSETPIPSPTASDPPTGTPAPTETATPEPERVQVFGSGNQFVNMRREPGTNSGVVKSVRDGTEVVIIGTDREADGRIWRNVQDGDATGWMVSTALRPLATPTATRASTATVTPTSTATFPPPAASPVPSSPPSPTSEPTAAPEPTAIPEPTATPEPEQIEVSGTGGGGANLRAEPSTGAPVLQSVPEGTRLTVIGPDREVDGRTWRNVRGEAGATGWIASEVTRSLATPTATAPPATTATPSATPGVSASEPSEPSEPYERPDLTSEPTPEPERVEVVGTGATGANLRAQPGLRGSVLRSVPDGSHLTIVGEDETADGIVWRHVQAEDGTTGWLAVEVVRSLITPTPTPRPGAPGVGAPIEEEPEPEEELTEAQRAATPCRPGQLKGDAATGTFYPVDHPEYAGLRERVRCFDDAARARASGYRPADPPEATPEPSPEPEPE